MSSYLGKNPVCRKSHLKDLTIEFRGPVSLSGLCMNVSQGSIFYCLELIINTSISQVRYPPNLTLIKRPPREHSGWSAQPRGTAVLTGFEPAISSVTGKRDDRYSTEPYAPRLGIEPRMTSFGGSSVSSTQGR